MEEMIGRYNGRRDAPRPIEWAEFSFAGPREKFIMAKFARFFVLLFAATIFAGMAPQANAQVVVKIGHRHHRHYYYRHGHRYCCR